MIHVRRSIELAGEALEAGDEPFGSVLVDGDGQVLCEDRNRATTTIIVSMPPIILRLLSLNRWQKI